MPTESEVALTVNKIKEKDTGIKIIPEKEQPKEEEEQEEQEEQEEPARGLMARRV